MSTPIQEGCRLNAVSTTPFRTTPGNPTDARSNRPCVRARPRIAFTIARGVAGRGVSTRARSTRGLPASSTTSVLTPVPPMSMQRVFGTAR
jgi:hypothetical protein